MVSGIYFVMISARMVQLSWPRDRIPFPQKHSRPEDQFRPLSIMSTFVKHAFRELISGFCKGTVPGAPPVPFPGPLPTCSKIIQRTYLVPPEGHILVQNMWSASQVVPRHHTRGTPLPIHKPPRRPQNNATKKYLVPGRLYQGTFEKPWSWLQKPPPLVDYVGAARLPNEIAPQLFYLTGKRFEKREKRSEKRC